MSKRTRSSPSGVQKPTVDNIGIKNSEDVTKKKKKTTDVVVSVSIPLVTNSDQPVVITEDQIQEHNPFSLGETFWTWPNGLPLEIRRDIEGELSRLNGEISFLNAERCAYKMVEFDHVRQIAELKERIVSLGGNECAQQKAANKDLTRTVKELKGDVKRFTEMQEKSEKDVDEMKCSYQSDLKAAVEKEVEVALAQADEERIAVSNAAELSLKEFFTQTSACSNSALLAIGLQR